jgi:thiosulfate dehydrogenase
MRGFLIGFLIGLVTIPLCLFLYLRVGRPPVAVADAPFMLEKQIVGIPLHARINNEMPSKAPIEANETNFVSGAKVYREQCAVCHGVYGQPSSTGEHMYPDAPALWRKHRDGVVGVSDDPPGETYWKVANGLRLTGMPAFSKTLNDTEMWQVTMLLANADKPMPDSVMSMLKQPLNFDLPTSGVSAVVPPLRPH